MSASSVIVVTAVFVMFGSFIAVMGAVSYWLTYCDWRDRLAARRTANSPAVEHEAPRSELRAA